MAVQTRQNTEKIDSKDSPEQKRVYFKEAFSSLQGLKNYVKHKFGEDQWFGTVYSIGLIYQTLLEKKAAENRQAVKKGAQQDDASALMTQKNMASIIAAPVFNFNNVWTLLSARDAKPPEGKNPLERMLNSLRHPQESQRQAVAVIALPFCLALYAQSFYRGFIDGEPEEKFSQRVSSVTNLIATYMAYSAMFGNRNAEKNAKKEEPEEKAGKESQKEVHFSRSQSKAQGGKHFYPVEVLKTCWRENKRLIIGAVIGIFGSIILFNEGRKKQSSMLERFKKVEQGSEQWDKLYEQISKEKGVLTQEQFLGELDKFYDSKLSESKAILRRSIVGLVLTVAGKFFSIDQLMKGEKKPDASKLNGIWAEEKANTMISRPSKEEVMPFAARVKPNDKVLARTF